MHRRPPPSAAPLPPCSLPLTPLLFSPHGQSRHGHSTEKHRGQPLPRSLSAFPRSVSSPASSSPSQASPDALQCRRHHLLLPRAPKAVIIDSSLSSLPRARFLHHPTHRGLLHIFPLTLWLAARRSRCFVDGRSKSPPELAAGVAPVTIWSPRRALRVRSSP